MEERNFELETKFAEVWYNFYHVIRVRISHVRHMSMLDIVFCGRLVCTSEVTI